MLPLIKVYQLENYKPKQYIKKVIKFNFAFGDKNKLKFTNRVKRLLIILFLLIFLIFFLFFYYFNIYVSIICAILGIIFSPFLLLFGHYIALPIEKMVICSYIKKAKEKLKKMPCRKIAITGSFGKTTTKNILFQILSEKYKVCATPKSFNTPMGVCRTILENLTEMDDYFIVEMGARHIGDIEFLCKFVGADYGVLTPVGNCHIETFKSLENVEKAKFEICENVNDFMVINGKSESNKKLYKKCEKKKYLICEENSFGYASDIKVNDFKSNFNLHLDGKTINVTTGLLGKANIDNIVLAACLAYLLNVNILDIKKGIETLKPIPHRMELIKGYVNVIDDSYNSNFDGFKQALEVLSSCSGRKILVTPGMVELGDKQYEMNFNIGKEIAKVCDVVLIMNKVNKDSLLAGITSSNYNGKIIFAETRKEQKNVLKELLQVGDTVLFENDLPDNYR